ncbi:pyrroline 5-carboyxlate reductase [Calliopsis andreniformis]|uniref:pyrroline 5-carboyxlate reductase n=1 Tax=Calliopsis andreniformis TaxID=337506 RepID=UPI003FCE0043
MASTNISRCDLKSIKVGFIGGGNMASAIGAGLIRKGILNPDNVWVSARTDRTLGFWNDLGAHATLKNGEVVDNCEIVFLAMKPHMLDDALEGVKATISKKIVHVLFVSVLVGVELDTLASKLKSVILHPRIIRCMPNTPMMVGEGITVYCSMDTTDQDEYIIQTLFSFIGVSEKVPESLINAIGGLSGSGPAYAYLIIEALADGAVKMGVPRPMATKFAAQVLIGAGKMVLETGRHPGQLKDEVCSPGGTTITGVHAMERGQVRASMMNAVEAAVNKSKELGSKLK